MKASCYTTLIILLLATGIQAHEPAQPSAPPATIAKAPHCEVPCGIYADQLRFDQMLEDTTTIAKAIDNIVEISARMSNGAVTPKDVNQVSRWVQTKEDHATHTQHIVAQYFLTQRIKADKDNYTKQLAAAHGVMVQAMKCKQDANPETAKALKTAILDLYRAYEGKEPQLHGDDHK